MSLVHKGTSELEAGDLCYSNRSATLLLRPFLAANSTSAVLTMVLRFAIHICLFSLRLQSDSGCHFIDVLVA